MKKLIPYFVIATFATLPAQAACYADYKAKMDNPLKLHYGVIELPDESCVSTKTATNAIAPRLRDAGWTLLTVLSIFDANKLEEKKASAGPYFLRF